MELVSIEGIYKKSLPFEETVLIPLGDIQHQVNREAVDWKRLERTIKWGVEHNALWIGMGDFIDNESGSGRRKIREADFYDSIRDALDAKAEELEDELRDLLAPTVGRWLGVLEGHHYHEYQDGSTTDTRFAQFLKAPFLGTTAYVNLSFKPKGKDGPVSYNILAEHGRGGGRLAGAPLSNIEKRIVGFDADLYLAGHTHQAGAVPRDRVYPYFTPTQGHLVHKTIYLVSTGAFLKSYIEGHRRNGRAAGLYPETAGMNPAHLGVAKIWFRPRYENRGSGGRPVMDLSVEA